VETEDSRVVLKQSAEHKPFIVVGIPAFNEEKTIARVVLKAQKHADKVVVCDDGSSDLTGVIAERLGAEVIRHDRNLGYGVAIQSLFRRARELDADVMVTLDADGQHDPNEIPNVVQPVVKGVADITVGSRFVDKRLASIMPWYRRAGIKFISKLVNNETGQGVADAQSGFRAYRGRCLEKLAVAENGMGASVEILMSAMKQGLRIHEVSAKCDYGGDVRKHVHNPVRHGVNVLMSIVKLVVEDKPLLFLGIPGMLCLATGAFFGVWMLQIYALERQIMTNVALASIAFILIGLFSIFTAITLYAISRLMQKTNNKH
jgi:glycosyltransferase involved in cell wall biosynthesis